MESAINIWNLIGENVAEVIALCALLFTAYQAHATRHHNRLSVKPHLCTFVNRSQNPGVGILAISLQNNGLGPALINDYKIYLDGKHLEIKNSKEFEKILEDMIGKYKFNHFVTVFGDDYAMPAKERKDILAVQFKIDGEKCFDEIEEKLNHFDVVVSYKSMYGEPGSYDSRKNDS